ncbi:arrestin domain-containing protein 1 [Biomphalaria pfeifferi]|uniref:Arrestin domain-containing protein 1 n=1 Tax=Biomphalaria pfeifferi TaxID=112525 RepID=A0AAD8C2L5_BIOPF|nr:arrestin domain-containing protein 1 [Biomphalaria pfeifferi]
MSVEDLLIHFIYSEEDEQVRHNRQYFLPGEEMKGLVSLHLRTGVRTRGLTIHFLGMATVSWESPKKRKVYQASEIYMESAKPLLDIGYDSYVDLPSGLHQFGFRYQLPTNLPSTFNGVYGQVTYIAKVKLECEDERDTTITSEPFMVLRRPELSPEIYDEKTIKKSKFFVGLTTGKVKVECTIDKSAAIPGDNIAINAEVCNWTGKEISLIQASMILESHYFAEGHEIVFRQYLSKRDDVYDVNTFRGRRWRNVLLPVPPYLPDSSLEHCKIMTLRYVFQFKVRIEGKEDIALETPLYVGTHSSLTGNQGKDLLLGKMWQGMDTLEEERSRKSELPWYGGRSMYTESVNGDIFDLRN